MEYLRSFLRRHSAWNQWWSRDWWAVFSDLPLIQCEKQKANIFTIKVFKVVRKEILLKKQMSS